MIAGHYPSTVISKKLLSVLIFDNSPGVIRVTSIIVVGTLLSSLGCLIRIMCYRTLGNFFTFELSLRKNHKLVTAGPYSVVRHPSYTGFLFALAGAFLCRGQWVMQSGLLDSLVGKGIVGIWTILVCIVAVALVLRIPSEDEVMKKEFGKEWVEWAQKVPYKLIPRVY